MIFGEALGVGGVLTKGLVNLGKKQLREKVIQENPGLNEDQVNSIVEDRGYNPTEDFGYATPGFGDPFPLEEGSFLRQNTYGDFIGDPASEIDQAYNRGELVPIVTAGDRVIGTA